jgi:hypothetical protein
MGTPRPMAIPMPSLTNRYPLEAAFARQLGGGSTLIVWVTSHSKFSPNLPQESNRLATPLAAYVGLLDVRSLADPGNIVAKVPEPWAKTR